MSDKVIEAELDEFSFFYPNQKIYRNIFKHIQSKSHASYGKLHELFDRQDKTWKFIGTLTQHVEGHIQMFDVIVDILAKVFASLPLLFPGKTVMHKVIAG